MSTRFPVVDILWISLWIALLGAIAVAMFSVRHSVLQSTGTGDQKDWEEWREAVQESRSAGGPVERRLPKSHEPPALVLMRDHFAVCLAIALVLSSVLFGTFVLFARGVMSSPGPQINLPSRPRESPAGDRH